MLNCTQQCCKSWQEDWNNPCNRQTEVSCAAAPSLMDMACRSIRVCSLRDRIFIYYSYIVCVARLKIMKLFICTAGSLHDVLHWSWLMNYSYLKVRKWRNLQMSASKAERTAKQAILKNNKGICFHLKVVHRLSSFVNKNRVFRIEIRDRRSKEKMSAIQVNREHYKSGTSNEPDTILALSIFNSRNSYSLR